MKKCIGLLERIFNNRPSRGKRIGWQLHDFRFHRPIITNTDTAFLNPNSADTKAFPILPKPSLYLIDVCNEACIDFEVINEIGNEDCRKEKQKTGLVLIQNESFHKYFADARQITN